MTMLPGPQSKAWHWAGVAPAGMAVMLAMPPMFCSTRPRLAWRKRT